MDDMRVGRICRALRRRRGWRQIDLAARAGCHQTAVSLIERGHVSSMQIRTVRRVFASMDASFDGTVAWRAGDLDRLLDERHAATIEGVARFLRVKGWEVHPEVTYSEFGERGSIDLLAARSADRAVAIFEIKSDVSVIEATLRKHDEKTRLVRERLTRRLFGWEPVAVGRVLAFPEDRTVRRRVEAHATTFGAAYPQSSRAVRAWFDAPTTSMSGIWFLTVKSPRLGSRNGGGPRRVRTPSPPP